MDPTWSQELKADHFWVADPPFERQPSGLGDLEPNRLAGLALNHRSSLLDAPGGEDISDPERDQIATTKLAVDGHVEQSKVPRVAAISRRTLTDQTCRGRSGRFWPMMRFLFQGTRTGQRTGRSSTDMGLPPVHRLHPSSVLPTVAGYHGSRHDVLMSGGNQPVDDAAKHLQLFSEAATLHPSGARCSGSPQTGKNRLTVMWRRQPKNLALGRFWFSCRDSRAEFIRHHSYALSDLAAPSRPTLDGGL